MSFFSFKKKSNTEHSALDAEVAAQEAYKRDKPLTNHAFEAGEHPIVRIEHLNKSFGTTPVLNDVNLTVWPGGSCGCAWTFGLRQIHHAPLY